MCARFQSHCKSLLPWLVVKRGPNAIFPPRQPTAAWNPGPPENPACTYTTGAVSDASAARSATACRSSRNPSTGVLAGSTPRRDWTSSVSGTSPSGRPGQAGHRVSQRIRKRVEEIFGWLKTGGGGRKLRYIGTRRNQLWAELAVTAFNLVRIGTLVAEPA